MIEQVLSIDTIITVLEFLDKNSLISYDTAILSKEYRPMFLESLRRLFLRSSLTISYWTIYRKLKSHKESIHYELIDHISDICKKLVIYGRHGNYTNTNTNTNLSVKNDNIETLYIDIISSRLHFGELKAKNLKTLTVVYPKNIDNLFHNLKMNCPNLKKILFIKCGVYDKNFMSELVNDESVNIICRE